MSMTSTMANVAPMSIYTILKGEHTETKTIIKMLEATPENVKTGRTNLWRKLRNELLSHAHAEQMTVYSRVGEKIHKKNLIDQSKAEHRQMEKIIKELDTTDITTEGWRERLMALREVLENHIQEEEDLLFAEMKSVFTEEEEKALGKAFREAKNKELQMLQGVKV